MTKLSVCIITLNEERRLPRAIDSVASFAGEVVIVDSGSSDRTRELARSAGATVIEQPWLGFGAQRNVALDRATGDWVLELDADEWCTPEFARELRAFLTLPPPPQFRMAVIPMRQRFLGRDLGPSGHYPFYRARLFRRDSYRHDDARSVHEGLWPQERPWVFRSALEHELAGDLREALRDVWAYARLESQRLGGASARKLFSGALLRPTVKFFYRSVLLGGWRDGPRGILRSALESLGDALTWVQAARTRGSTTPPGGHFGRLEARNGPVFLLAVGDPSGSARPWLEEALSAGAWVSVICSRHQADPALAGDAALRIAALPRLGPLALMRALDAESQLSPVRAHVALDASGARLLKLLPFVDEVVRSQERPAAEVVAAARASER